MRQFTNPKAVTHPRTSRAECGANALIVDQRVTATLNRHLMIHLPSPAVTCPRDSVRLTALGRNNDGGSIFWRIHAPPVCNASQCTHTALTTAAYVGPPHTRAPPARNHRLATIVPSVSAVFFCRRCTSPHVAYTTRLSTLIRILLPHSYNRRRSVNIRGNGNCWSSLQNRRNLIVGNYDCVTPRVRKSPTAVA